MSEDPETGEQGYFEVVALTNHPTDEVLRVTIEAEAKAEAEKETETLDTSTESSDNGKAQLNSTTEDQPTKRLTDQTTTMEITPDHPVYVEGKGWLWAENLAIGDRLRRSDGGWATVLAVERVKLAEPELVYNFTVKGPHTYFVLEVGVLVHNDDCIPNLGPDARGRPFQTDIETEGRFFGKGGRAEIEERQRHFWERANRPDIVSPGSGFCTTDWNRGKCDRFAQIFKEDFGDDIRIIRQPGLDSRVYVDGEMVGHYHAFAVDGQRRVWDPATNTWGQNLENYLARVSYNSPKGTIHNIRGTNVLLPYRPGGKGPTFGFFIPDKGDWFPISSGTFGYAEDIPKGTPGFTGITRKHVEGHAAAYMRKNNIRGADLLINNDPCPVGPGCNNNLKYMLPEGARLRVYNPHTGFKKTYVGEPD